MSGADPQVFDTDVMRNRLMHSEYGNLTEEKVEQIYMEGKGEHLPESTKIEVYNSRDYSQYRTGNDYSGFDGAVIHVYDEEKGINETYTIARGSENAEESDGLPRDWLLQNAGGTVTGKVTGQSKDLDRFESKIMEKIESKMSKEGIDTELQPYGLGHSLGGGLMTKHQMENGHYNKVYTTNPAPVNVHEMVFIDKDFRKAVRIKFGIDPDDDKELYALDRRELAAFAEQYYKNKIDESSIQHMSMQEDILYGALVLPGMMDFGERHVINSIEGYDGLQSLVRHIPEEVVAELQMYLAKMADASNEGGYDAAVIELVGLDAYELFGAIDSWKATVGRFGDDDASWGERLGGLVGSSKGTIDFLKEVDFEKVGQKLADAIETVQYLRENAEEILGVLVQEGFLTEGEKDAIIQELSTIEYSLKSMSLSVAQILTSGGNPLIIGMALDNINRRYDSLLESFGTLGENVGPMLEMIGQSKEAHLLTHVLATLGDPGYHADQSMIALFSRLTGSPPEFIESWLKELMTSGLGLNITPRIMQTKEAFVEMHNFRIEAEKLRTLALVDDGVTITDSNVDYALLSLSVEEKCEGNMIAISEVALKDAANHNRMIEQYWENDEELARMFKLEGA